MEHTVKIAWDDEARVWYSTCEDLHIFLEAEMVQDLIRMNKESVADLLELEGKAGESCSLSFMEQPVLKAVGL
jgi:hypothetical protein